MAKPIGQEFLRQTRYENMSPSPQMRGKPPPALELPFAAEKLIALPPPETAAPSPVDFKQLVDKRESVRHFGPQALGRAELSYLLWCTQGVKNWQPPHYSLRTVPSAGARHALETYLLLHRVEGLEPGLYRFVASQHALLLLDASADTTAALFRACLEQDFVMTCGAVFFWIADIARMRWRYGQRGYRYIHLDAGHVCQNLYLSAESVNAGVCAIAAFADKDLDRALGLDGRERFAVYVAACGKKPLSA